jgi:phage-related protein
MNFFITYLPSLVAALIGVLSVFNADIQGIITAHPAIASSLAALYAILSHLMPSPVQAPPAPPAPPAQ